MNDTPHALQRWTRLVLAVLDSHEDIRTLRHWSHHVGVSVTQLREYCRLADIGAKASLDFARLLRAVLRHRDTSRPLRSILDLSDVRTFVRMLRRAGCGASLHRLSPEEFVRQQKLVTDPTAIVELLAALEPREYRALQERPRAS